MDYQLEVITLSVSDVDQAAAFYTQAGFILDVDYHLGDNFRVLQLTQPGSACSIHIGVGFTDAPRLERRLGRRAPTPTAGTTPASPTSPTRTATPGRSRKSAESATAPHLLRAFLQSDPVAALDARVGCADIFQDTTVAFDAACRRDVVVVASDEDSIQAERTGLW